MGQGGGEGAGENKPAARPPIVDDAPRSPLHTFYYVVPDLPSITHTRLIPTPLQGVCDHTVYLDGLKSSTLGASYAATLDELKVSFRRIG